MATSTIRGFEDAGIAGVDEAPIGTGFWSRAFRRFVAAREARGRSVAYYHMARLSEERLADLGHGPAEIRRIKSFADYPGSYWV
jgi:hypothetical protein